MFKDILIESLGIDKWCIATYQNSDRIRVISELMHNELGLKIPISTSAFINQKYNSFIHRDGEDFTFSASPYAEFMDLTQRFNDYLQENDPRTWLISIVSARLMELSIEKYFPESKCWEDTDYGSVFTQILGTDHRIRSKLVELVPDIFWDMIDDDIVAIAREYKGRIIAFRKIPEKISSRRHYYINDDGAPDTGETLFGIKCLKHAKIMDVHWRNSLCVRPAHKRTQN